MARSDARDAALRLLYEAELDGDGGIDGLCELLEVKFGKKDRAYIEEMLGGVAARLPSLDGIIEKHANNWEITRMPRVDLCILRLAVYEMLHTDTPESIAINEAVELAKEYGGDNSSAFINGVLGAISRDPDAPKDPDAKKDV